MDGLEFAGWMAYFKREPFDFQADDIRFSMLISLYMNAHRASDSQPVNFAFPWQRETVKQELTEEQEVARWQVYARITQAMHASSCRG